MSYFVHTEDSSVDALIKNDFGERKYILACNSFDAFTLMKTTFDQTKKRDIYFLGKEQTITTHLFIFAVNPNKNQKKTKLIKKCLRNKIRGKCATKFLSKLS